LLDPLSLASTAAGQRTALRPYKTPAENDGRETATLAMG